MVIAEYYYHVENIGNSLGRDNYEKPEIVTKSLYQFQ